MAIASGEPHRWLQPRATPRPEYRTRTRTRRRRRVATNERMTAHASSHVEHGRPQVGSRPSNANRKRTTSRNICTGRQPTYTVDADIATRQTRYRGNVPTRLDSRRASLQCPPGLDERVHRAVRAPNIGTTSRPGHGQFDRTHSALDYVGKTPQWWTTGTPRRAGSRTQHPLGLSERVRRPTRAPQRRRRANIGSDDRANRGRRRTTWGYPLYDGQSSRQTERPAHTPATRLTCASATLAARD